MKDVFRYQFVHFIAVLILIYLVQFAIGQDRDISQGSLWGLSTVQWLWLAVAVPVAHQVYVWLIWRIELYYHTLTSFWGIKKAFAIYSVGFSVLFVSRLIFISILAYSNQATLAIDPMVMFPIAVVIALLSGYLFYSVKKYFTIKRAFGIDHFDKNYNEPFVKQGIFRYTDNGMYIYGLMVLYLPGLLLMSKAGLLVAIFNHLYIWVHYYCTERPDMVKIFGEVPGMQKSL